MHPKRKEGAFGRAVAKLKEKAERLLGERRTTVPNQEDEVERELREAYDKPGDAIRARSGFRQ